MKRRVFQTLNVIARSLASIQVHQMVAKVQTESNDIIDRGTGDVFSNYLPQYLLCDRLCPRQEYHLLVCSGFHIIECPGVKRALNYPDFWREKKGAVVNDHQLQSQFYFKISTIFKIIILDQILI